MLETPECQGLRHVRDCAMSGTAARQWWSLEWRGGAAGVAIEVAGARFLTPASPAPAVLHDWLAVDTLDKPPAVGLIREVRTSRAVGTRD